MLGTDISKHIKSNDKFKNWIANLTDREIIQFLEHCYSSFSICTEKKSSSSKGRDGEQLVYNALKHYDMKNTAKCAKSGDFQIKTDVGTILIEVKNYTKTVGRIELDKFERDIARDNKIKGAVFISLDAKIVGYKEAIHFEEELIDGRTLPIVYLNTTDPKIIKITIDLVIAHIKSKLKTNDIDVDFVISKVNEMSKQLGLLSQCRNQIVEMRTIFNKLSDDLYRNIAYLELGLSKIIGEIHSQIKWKREIPVHTLNDLYKFVDTKYQLNKKDRPDILLIKRIIKEIYFPHIVWYFTEKFISTCDIKIYVHTNTIWFKKCNISKGMLKKLLIFDDIIINRYVIIPIKKTMTNIIIELIFGI